MQQKLFLSEGLTSRSPYVYWIEHIPSKRIYHGRKYAIETCDSSTFMTSNGYKTSSSLISQLIESDGLDSFRVLCVRHYATKQDVIDYEHNFLNMIDAKNNPRYLNESNGGLTFRTKEYLSENHKEKISKKLKGHTHSDETRKKISESLKGRKHTEEQNKRKSESQKGRVMSESGKENLRKARKNRLPISLETKNKISNMLTGIKHTQERNIKKSKNSKGLKWYNNGVINRRSKEDLGPDWIKGRIK
jgi:hypothetical protein